MGWIIRIFAVTFLLAALHNWDLWCANPHIGYVDELSTTYLGRAALFGFIGLVMIVYEVDMYFTSRHLQYYDTRIEAEAVRVSPNRIRYNKEKGYYIEKVESVFQGK